MEGRRREEEREGEKEKEVEGWGETKGKCGNCGEKGSGKK